MQNVNTQGWLQSHVNSMHMLVLKALPSSALKTGLLATLFLCCFSQQALLAQCSTPSINCKGDHQVKVYLGGNGQAQVLATDVVLSWSTNCNPPGIPTFLVSPNGGSITCSPMSQDSFSVGITVTITNEQGQSNSCTTIVDVFDKLPPAITCPANVTYTTCGNSTNPTVTGFATATDNCGGPLVQKAPCTLSGDGITYCDTWSGCTGKGITRVWTATYHGLSSTCTQMININDTTNPTLDWNGPSPGYGTPPPATIIVSCSPGVPAPVSFSAADNCDTSPSLSVSDVSNKGTDPWLCNFYNYTVTRTYKAVDDCNNTATFVQTIIVQDITPPQITGVPDTVKISANSSCEAVVTNLNASVSDNCAGNAHLVLSWIIVGITNPLVTYSGSGNLNANGTYPAGIYAVQYTAMDPCGNIGIRNVILKIEDNVAPVAACVTLSNVSVPPSGTVTLTRSMVDNGSHDNCTPDSLLVFTMVPPTFSCSDVGSFSSVTVTVKDLNGNSANCGPVLIQVLDSSPPAMFCKPTIIRYLNSGGYVEVNANEIDDGSNDACGLSSFDISKDGGNTYGPTTTFLCPEIGLNDVILRVRDANGNYGFCNTKVDVRDTENPVAQCNADTIYLKQDGTYTLELLQFDSTKANGTDVTIPSPGSITSSVTFFGEGIIKDVNVFVKIDHRRVGDLSLKLTSPEGTTIWLGDRPGYSGSGFGCTGDTLIASFDDAALSPAEAFENACNSSAPAILGTFQPLDPLSSFNGENPQGVWSLEVIDNQGPAGIGTIDSFSVNIVYERWSDTEIGFGSHDNCCAWQTTVSQTAFTCNDIDTNPYVPGNQPVVYTLTVTDASGNANHCTGTIQVLDVVLPVITCKDTVDLFVNSDGNAVIFPDSLINGGIYISSGSDSLARTNYCVTTTNLATISFDWEYTSHSISLDSFGYSVNGAFTKLTNDLGGQTQSGTQTVFLTVGQTFCFSVFTVDNSRGNAEIWIKNFSQTFTGDFAISKWTPTFVNSNGKAFFVDASVQCGPIRYQVSLDSIGWNPTDTLFCDSLGIEVPVWVRAVDKYDNVSATECAVTLVVKDGAPPIAACDAFSVSLGGNGKVRVYPSDFDDGSVDLFCGGSLTLLISDDGGNNFYPSIEYDCGDLPLNPIEIVFQAIDAAGNKAFCVTSLDIQDKNPPVITCPADITISCEIDPIPANTGLATATDNCAGSVLPYIGHETFYPILSGLPPSFFNASDCQRIYRRWDATDGTNTSSCFQNITIQDLVAPQFSWPTPMGLPPASTITVNYCAIPSHLVPGRTDNCDNDVTYEFIETDSRFTCSGNQNCFTPAQCGYYDYTLNRSWEIWDNCGNRSAYAQVVYVRDQVAPVFSFPANFQFNNNPGSCSGTAVIELWDYIADCAAADQYLTITYKIDGGSTHLGHTINTLLTVGTHLVEVTATDPCGNMRNHTIPVIINDVESPTAKCKTGPILVSLNSLGQASITPADVDNNSSDNCGIAQYDIDISNFDCNTTPNPHPVTLTVTDAVGNFNKCTTNVLIQNVTPPTILCPNDAVVSCEVFDAADPSTSGGFAQGFSDCGPVVPVYVDVTVSGAATPNCREIERTWTVTTGGGSASCVQRIELNDNEPAVLVGVPPFDITVEACAVPTPPVVSATDNCSSPSVNYNQTSNQDPDQSLPGHYNYVIHRTWSTHDGCQESSTTGTQRIEVIDTLRPVVNIPNPLIVYTNSTNCLAPANVNLLDYISDCAIDQYLAVTYSAPLPVGNGASLIAGNLEVGDYPVTVTATDPSGNTTTKSFVLSIRDNTDPQAACHDAATVVLDGGGNGSLIPEDIDNGSTDNCGNISLSISPSTFTTADIGVVNVVLTVTDDAGNTNSCTTPVTVIQGIRITAGIVEGEPGSTPVNIPVSVSGFDDICALSFSLHIPDPTAATVIGVDISGSSLPGIDLTDFAISGNDIAFNWIDLGGIGVTLPPNSIIFNVTVTMGGVVGSTSAVTIDGTPTPILAGSCDGLAPEPDPVSTHVVPGSVTVIASVTHYALAGTIRQENGTPVQLANVALTGSILGNQTTGVPGAYSFSVQAGSNSVITPEKDINDCNGVNVLDIHALQSHILNVNLLPSFYRYVAADINRDNKINVFDRLALHTMITSGTPGNPCPGLPQNTSWRFVDSAWVTPALPLVTIPAFPEAISVNPVSADHHDLSFVGVKIGDLDLFGVDPTQIVGGTGDQEQIGSGIVVSRSSEQEFVIDDQPVKAGEEYRVSFKASDFSDLVAYQYTLGFDKTKLQFKDVEMGVLPELTPSHFGTIGAADGYINAIWYSTKGTSIADGEELFTLVFDATGDADNLSDLLYIQTLPLQGMAAKANMDVKGVKLVFNTTTGTAEAQGNRLMLYQNRPNPFSGETIIPFRLPQAAHATLTITDISGKVVKVLEGDFTGGQHEFKVNRKDLTSAGVFFYRIDTAFGSAVNKMVLID